MMIRIKIHSGLPCRFLNADLHPPICLNICLSLRATPFYCRSVHALHLAVNERGMGRWRMRGSERGPSVWRDKQMWDRKRKTDYCWLQWRVWPKSTEQLSAARSPFVHFFPLHQSAEQQPQESQSFPLSKCAFLQKSWWLKNQHY